MMTVYIAEHERYKSLEAYSDWLSEKQAEAIREREEDCKIIKTKTGTVVTWANGDMIGSKDK